MWSKTPQSAEPQLSLLPQPLFVFDGVCVLCSGAVRFVIAREKDTALHFAPAQSDVGQAVLQALGLPQGRYETLVVVEDGRGYVKSAAVMRLATRLRQPWRLLGHLAGLVPRSILDWLYDRIARNRYRLFGRYDACMVPAAGVAHRFVERTSSSQPR